MTEEANVNSNKGRSDLIDFVERIERLEATKSEIADDIVDVFTEAKSAGFDVKVMRMVIRRRKMDADKRRQQDEMIALYEGIFG